MRHYTEFAVADQTAKNQWKLGMSSLAPVNGVISVKVYDWDALSADDLMSNINLTDGPVTDNKPWDGAEYETTAEFDR